MNRPTTAIPAALALLFTAGTAYPQPQPNQNTRYASALYLRVPADKIAAFIAWNKSGPGAKAARERLNADSNLIGISLRQATYAGVNAPQANFVLVAVTNGPPADPDPAKRDELYRKATGMVYADYIAKARELSTVTGSTLSHVHEMTPDYQSSEGDYLVVQRIKVAEGRNPDLTALNREVRLPMNTERVKNGAIKGWSSGHLVFPSGTSLPWTGTETTLHKSLASAVGGPGPGGATGGGGGAGAGGGFGNPAVFAKVAPNRNYTQYVDRLRESRTVVRTDLYRVVAAHRR
ncbi:MAG: hypothetical protein HYR60_04080 [Acidobacteria bacterium]|nr:hypothetical protein [Acidobacteriota bacterium]